MHWGTGYSVTYPFDLGSHASSIPNCSLQYQGDESRLVNHTQQNTDKLTSSDLVTYGINEHEFLLLATTHSQPIHCWG